MAEITDGKFDLRGNLIWILLAASLGSSGYSLVNTDDRFRGTEGRVLETRVNYHNEKIERIEKRQDEHRDSHPDRGLQLQINEIREELIRMNARIATQENKK